TSCFRSKAQSITASSKQSSLDRECIRQRPKEEATKSVLGASSVVPREGGAMCHTLSQITFLT
ncbi:unnamed protein product, partial [Citrullus colocynthis]